MHGVSLDIMNYQKRILSKERIKVLEYQYLNDPLIKNINTLDKTLKMELVKKRNFQIAVFSDFEIVGLEEIYLHMEHYAKALVLCDKIYYNELPLSKFKYIFQNEMRLIRESYVQVSVNRILSLLKRLFDIKQNFLSMAKIRNNEDSKQFYDKIVETSKSEHIFNNIPQIKLVTKNMNNNEIKNEVKRKLTLKSAKPIKSAKKIRNTKLILEINKDNKERAKSGKLEQKSSRNLREEDFKKHKNKINNTIVIGNKKININVLRKKIKEYEFIKEIEENSKTLKKNDDIIINQQQMNLMKSYEEKANNIIEYKNNINMDKDKTRNFKLKNLNIFINISENNKIKPRKNNYSLLNMNNFSTNNHYSNRINLNFPMSINPIKTKLFHDIKSKFYNSITDNNNNINKNKAKNVQTIANSSNIENSELNFLPKIESRLRSNENLRNKLNSKNMNTNSIRNQLNDKIPQIVKNYYLQKKKKGYTPLIVNKKSNTIFLRKYHKKYNEN